ncbi:MAG: EAL domain-containing protein [Pseudomonadota bacterium]
MPAIAHAMILATYAMACAVGGIALHRYYAVDVITASLVAAAVGLALAHLHTALARAGGYREVDERLLKLRDDTRKMSSRLETVERVSAELQDAVEHEATARRETLVNEMRGLEEMVAKLGKNFEARMQTIRDGAAVSTLDGAAALNDVRDALRQNRVDLHLQPIVNLPQRRVCFYEGFTRLRRADGKLIMPSEFLAAADRAGLLGVIDNMLLFRCVQIVRRLAERDRRVGVFCNISMSSLEDESFFPQFLEFMRDHRDLAGSMIFEIGLTAFEGRSDIARRNMERLVDLGFRFSLDKADTLAVDLPTLQASGVRFMKVNAERMAQELTEDGERPMSAIVRHIAPEDVSAVYMRYGVDLVVDKVEDEKSVIELLDFDIPYGQGHVFGAPRPIKGSLLEETAPPPDFLRRVGAAAE